MSNRIKTYSEFYLTEHQNRTSRILHFIGTFLVFIIIGVAIYNQWSWKWFLVPLVGYGFAWVGHFFFEHNKPATFKYPLYSLLGDWVMFKDILLGNIKR